MVEPLPRGAGAELWSSSWSSTAARARLDRSVQIRSCAERIALDRTLFIVSSKSRTTLESNILMRYFLDRVSVAAPPGTVAERFVAVTDPGSELERFAAN